jgi:CubicO group peptidase (beta-lactamase class C family)
MEHYDVPGVSVAVINDGTLEWARGYGVLESGANKAVDTETLFQSASIGKAVTALLALRLVQEGQIELDRNINDYLKSWRLPENQFTAGNPVTPAHILSHSGGLTVHGFGGYGRDDRLPTLRQVLDGTAPNSNPVRVTAAPGESWRYSGGGYCVLQQALEDVSGLPFPEIVKAKLFEPLGMAHTAYDPLPAQAADIASSGHLPSGEMVEGKWRVFVELGAGAGLWTTPSDLARFVIGIQRSVSGAPDSIISPKLARLMVEPKIGSWSLGMNVGVVNGKQWFSHSGDNTGYHGLLYGFVEGGRGAVVMVNSNNGPGLAREIMRSIAAEYGWSGFKPIRRQDFQPTSAELQEYAGTYRTGVSGTQFSVRHEDGRLLAGLGSDMDGLSPIGKDIFQMETIGWIVEFLRDSRGTVVGMTVDKELMAIANQKVSGSN